VKSLYIKLWESCKLETLAPASENKSKRQPETENKYSESLEKI